MGTLSFIVKAHVYLVLAGVLYVLACLCMSHPALQRQYLFLHNVRYPPFAKYEEPELYGALPGAVRNMYLDSTNNVSVGTWHFLPGTFFDARSIELQTASPEQRDAIFDQALRDYPTYLYLHGNALNRAAKFRVRTCNDLSRDLNANVITIDYRGFGDTPGIPTEEGVIEDAMAAVEYAVKMGYNADTDTQQGLGIVGQSLGTAIGAQVALRMHRAREQLDALVLLAPFSELQPMVSEFSVAGVFPVLRWLDFFPWKDQLLNSVLIYKFNTYEALSEIMNGVNDVDALTPPFIVVMHAMDDSVINVKHSDKIFSGMVNLTNARSKTSAYHVWRTSVPEFGYVESIMSRTARRPEVRGIIDDARFLLPRSGLFSYVKLESGGHDHLLVNNTDALQLMLPVYMQGNDSD